MTGDWDTHKNKVCEPSGNLPWTIHNIKGDESFTHTGKKQSNNNKIWYKWTYIHLLSDTFKRT